MTRDEIHKAILEFTDLFDVRSANAEERQKSLIIALDRLALAYHFADYNFDEGKYPDAPEGDYSTLRKSVETIFPDYGYYNVASPITEKIGEAEVLIGDAIDDITDIALEMYEVVWLWENTTVENALWHFRFGYESHWGEHLRELQLYLNAHFQGL